MTLSTDIAVLSNGVVQQYDNPDVLYKKPSNLFVADFMGDPQVNLINGIIKKEDDKASINILENIELAVPQDLEKEMSDGQPIVVGINPENIEVSLTEKNNFFPFNVLAVLDSGAERYIYIRTDNEDIVVCDVFKISSKNEDLVYVRFPLDSLNLYERESGQIIVSKV